MALPQVFPLSQCTTLLYPDQHKTFRVVMDDPATAVMTTFRKIRPFTISGTFNLNEAKNKMIACGVRLLFVTNSDSNIAGLITATDLVGERPIKYIQEHPGSYDGILVQDIMTGVSQLQAFEYRDIVKLKVAELIEAMRECQRQHMLVIEKDSATSLSPLHGLRDNSTSCTSDSDRIVGLFSTTQIERQTGVELPITNRARSFLEIEEALA